MDEAENIENSEEADPETGSGGEYGEGGSEGEGLVDQAANDADPADQPDELELAYGEVADLKDKLLRAMAETENLRRRSEREKAELRKYAIADFARDMLAVSDNLQRALASVSEEARNSSPEMGQLLEGVELTQRELQGHFDKHGITEISPLGEKLDPNLHQAVVQMDHPEAPHGTIVQVMQPGYMIQDRLLRAAMVGVAKGLPAPKADDANGEPNPPGGGHNVDTQA
ncbi:MAG: nucleotide exchange factor GrpE [Alphaproteobacteria bacterium]|nr:nucleotide exchange factor GrpE [Alphaproteobacteria bacterium]